MHRKSIVLTGKAQAECQCEDFQFDAAELKTNEAVIETSMSLISAGTELSRVYANRGSVIQCIRDIRRSEPFWRRGRA